MHSIVRHLHFRKKGPARIRLSSLPQEPVALFSRVGMGEIVVVEDGEEIVNDGDGQTLDQNSIQDVVTRALELAENENEAPQHAEDDSVEASPAVRSDPTPDKAQNGKGHHNLRPGRKRSYRQFADVMELPESSSSRRERSSPGRSTPRSSTTGFVHDDNGHVNEDADGPREAMTSQSRDPLSDCDEQTTPAPPSKRAYRTNTEIRDYSLRKIEAAVRLGFADIKGKLNALELGEEAHFARSVAGALLRLPDKSRALAKLKIQQVLYDAECEAIEDALDAEEAADAADREHHQQQVVAYTTGTVVAVEDGHSIVLCQSQDVAEAKAADT